MATAAAAARSPSPGQARPCCAMRRSADSSPFKPADCPQRSSASFSKGGGVVCGCHASPRRRSFGEKENDAARTPKAARASGSKNFMAPTISATSKAVAASPSPRKKVLGERNEETHLFAPFSPANLAHKPKGGPPAPEAGSARRLRLSFDGPLPAAPGHGSRSSFGEEDAGTENHRDHAAADSVDAEPSREALYDPKTNYTSPRPRFLHYKPNPRVEMYRQGGGAARRLDEGLASSESSEESVTATTDDDLTEEEQEPAHQQIPDEPSAVAAPSEAEEAAAVPAPVSCVLPSALAAPSEAQEAAAVPAAASCVLPPEPAPHSPRAPVVACKLAAMSPPARVLATEPRANSPPTRALTPEPELGVSAARAPTKKKRSTLRFMFPLALLLFVAAAAFVCVSPPDSPIMSNPALSKVSNFLSVQELHPVELAAWLKQWSSSSLDSITSYWEAAFASTQSQEFGPPFAANLSAASADADHGADFYYNFAEASRMPSEEPIGASVLGEQLKIEDVVSASNTDLTAMPEGDVIVEEESVDDDAVEEESADDDAVEEESDSSEYHKVVEELDVEISEEAPGSNGASFLDELLNIEDVASQSDTAQEVVDAAVAGYYTVAEELDLEMPEAPGSNGEEMFSQNLDIPSQPTGEPEQDVEIDESEGDHTNGKEGQEAYRDLKSDLSMWPSYLDKISNPAAAGVALLVVILSAGIAVFSMRKKQTQVAPNASAPAEEPEQAEGHHLVNPSQLQSSMAQEETVKPSQSVSGSSQGHLAKPSQFQSSMAEEETERFGDSALSQYSSSMSSGQGRRRKTKEEEGPSIEPTSRRESTAHSTSSYGSYTTLEKIAAKKKNKEDEAMTPVRRSSRLRTVKSPEA